MQTKKLGRVIARIVAWGILNTGLYLYFANIRGADPDTVRLTLGLVWMAAALAWMAMILATPDGREFHRRAVTPLGILMLGFVSSMYVTFFAAVLLTAIAAWCMVLFLEEDHLPIDLKQWLAVTIALIAVNGPMWGWSWEGASDDLVSFLLPIGPTVALLALAYALARRPSDFSFNDALDRGRERPGSL